MEQEISWVSDSHLGIKMQAWWDGLKKDRASRAMLRRCATLDDVVLSPAYQRFYRYLIAVNAWSKDAKPWQNEKLAAIAGLLAHVEVDDIQSLPFSMYDQKGEKLLVSELRFRNILKVDDVDDLFTDLRRILPLIENRTNTHQLAHDVYWWNDKTKKQWAYSYRWPLKQSA